MEGHLPNVLKSLSLEKDDNRPIHTFKWMISTSCWRFGIVHLFPVRRGYSMDRREDVYAANNPVWDRVDFKEVCMSVP